MAMKVIVKNNDCGSCKKAIAPKDNHSWITGVMMVVLPKCPFCVFAYSSTIMLCGKDSVTSKTSFHYSEMTVLFTAILCSITLLSIALNRRGKRTLLCNGHCAGRISHGVIERRLRRRAVSLLCWRVSDFHRRMAEWKFVVCDQQDQE